MTKMGEGQQREQLLRNTLCLFSQATEMRDWCTAHHSARTADYALLLAEELKVPTRAKTQLQVGSLLHDLGVIGIGDDILRKPGPLTADEFEVMKTHALKGAGILEQTPQLAVLVPMLRSHHERWAGDGYPDRLKGDQIPYLARIIAVADAFDAMTSKRPYRHGMPADAAFAELEVQKGKQFDPEIARAFLGIRQHVVQVMDSHQREGPQSSMSRCLVALGRITVKSLDAESGT